MALKTSEKLYRFQDDTEAESPEALRQRRLAKQGIFEDFDMESFAGEMVKISRSIEDSDDNPYATEYNVPFDLSELEKLIEKRRKITKAYEEVIAILKDEIKLLSADESSQNGPYVKSLEEELKKIEHDSSVFGYFPVGILENPYDLCCQITNVDEHAENLSRVLKDIIEKPAKSIAEDLDKARKDRAIYQILDSARAVREMKKFPRQGDQQTIDSLKKVIIQQAFKHLKIPDYQRLEIRS